MSNNLIFNRINRNYDIIKNLLDNKQRLLYSVHILEKEMFLDAELSDKITDLVLNYYITKIENDNKDIIRQCEV